MNAADRAYVQQAIDFFVLSGYHTDELTEELDTIVSDLVGEAPEALIAELRERVREGFARRRVEEATWSEETLNDRLEEAFAELWDSGIVALENAGYSDEEGWEDCREHADTADEPTRGVVFFHGRDVERAVAGEGLSLTFGVLGDGDPVAIGREVCTVLAKYDIPTVWSEHAHVRIGIPPFEWCKRQFTAPP